MNPTIEKQYNGSILIYDLINGHLERRIYYFYSVKESLRLFKKEFYKKEKEVKK